MPLDALVYHKFDNTTKLDGTSKRRLEVWIGLRATLKLSFFARHFSHTSHSRRASLLKHSSIILLSLLLSLGSCCSNSLFFPIISSLWMCQHHHQHCDSVEELPIPMCPIPTAPLSWKKLPFLPPKDRLLWKKNHQFLPRYWVEMPFPRMRIASARF